MTERSKYVIIVAGGSGTRMGGKTPKQFLEISGKAVLHHTIDKFAAAIPGINTVLVLPEEWKEPWKEYCYRKNLVLRQTIVSGGITRFHSVKNALRKIPDGAIAGIHDGVRPAVSTDMIKRLFALAETCPAVIPVIPVVDTLKVLEKTTGPDGEVSYAAVPGEQADRNRLFGAQTPQVFRSEILKKAYSVPYSTEFTDDASVVEKYGEPLKYVDGEKYNIKITVPEDLPIAGTLLKAGR